MKDEDIRRWYQRRRPIRPGSHPEPEALAAVASRSGPEAERLAVLDHVGQCGDCRRELDLLRAVAPPAPRVIPAWAAIAATVALVLGGATVWRATQSPGVVRDAGGAVSLVAPMTGATDPKASGQFVWRAVPGALRYRFELVAEDGRSLAIEKTVDTVVTLTVPLSAGRYRWWVAAEGAGREWTSEARALVVE